MRSLVFNRFRVLLCVLCEIYVWKIRAVDHGSEIRDPGSHPVFFLKVPGNSSPKNEKNGATITRISAIVDILNTTVAVMLDITDVTAAVDSNQQNWHHQLSCWNSRYRQTCLQHRYTRL